MLGARGPDRLQALAARITETGGEAAHARTDARRDDLATLVAPARERDGRLDVPVDDFRPTRP